MSNFNIGDLVWVPDGTLTYVGERFIGVPISGPVCGLVLKVTKDAMSGWLLVKIGNSDHGVAEKDVRKINKEEMTYGQINRGCTNIQG